jgi:hypothetical protein
MLIRIGFEIIVECAAPTPFLLALLPHSSYGGRVIGSDQIRAEPEIPLEEYLDLSFPKIISGRIDDAARPGRE